MSGFPGPPRQPKIDIVLMDSLELSENGGFRKELVDR